MTFKGGKVRRGLSARWMPNGFNPLSLFAAGEQGAWYDVSDISTMYQDSAGSTPVTAAGQTVGLLLDKSKGLALGPERLTNGEFSNGSTGWAVDNADATHIVTFASGTMRYKSDTTTPQLNVTQLNALEVGKWYKITVVCSAWVSGSLKTDVGNGSPVLASGVGTFTNYILANNTTLTLTRNSANVDITIDNISVLELPGNHASQTTAARRPQYNVDASDRPYLLFDGVDDFLVTSTITPGTGKAQMFAGVRKLSDAAVAIVAELSASVPANNGSLQLLAPASATPTYGAASKGTIQSTTTVTGFAAPNTAVLSYVADIAGDVSTIRANRSTTGTNFTDQGTGNYLAYPLYIGCRGGTSLPFNGRIYGLITRFGENLTDATIVRTETWLNSKTGAY